MDDAEPQQISNITIKIPPFWPSDPQLWFAQVEALFSCRGITREATKFQHVVGSLSADYATEVRDLLLNPPQENAYTQLKEAMLTRLAESSQLRLQRLLTSEELGDRKPSQLLRRMQQLLGPQTISQGEEELLKELFLQRLPSNIRLILAGTSTSIPLQAQAELADKMLGHVQSVNAVSTDNTLTLQRPHPTTEKQPPTSDPMLAIQAQLQDLQLQLNNVNQQLSRSRSPANRHQHSNSRYRQRSSSRYREDGNLCYYHFTFGKDARKCGKTSCKMAEIPLNTQTGH